jgi:hypothetical protein
VARSLGTRYRFTIAYLALGALVGAALGAFIVLAKRPGPQPAPPWSSWKPASTGRTQLLEIANHVGQGYLRRNGAPLAPIRVGGQPGGSSVQAIGIQTKDHPKTLADFKLYRPQSKNAIYILCGTGKNCAIPGSDQQLPPVTALRREALEVALYTLEYAKPVDNVLVFFPPAAGANKLSETLFFHRSSLESSLHHPLRRTLPESQPLLPGQIAPAERQTVDDLTKSTDYQYISIANAPGFGRIVVVKPTG